jgi:hypothetical protein
MTHTPPPYYVVGEGSSAQICTDEYGENRVAFMAHSNGRDPDRDAATAAFIARAVNAHAAMLAAIKEYMSCFGQSLAAHGIDFTAEQIAADKKIRAAIAIAEGKP